MNEVRFKIGADTSALSRGFAAAQSIAANAGAQMRKKFDMKESFKSGVLALGLSIEKIAEKVAEIFTGGTQQAWKNALDSATEAARIIEESTMKRMDTLRQIQQIEKEIKRNRENENAAPKTEKVKSPGFFSYITGRMEGGSVVENPTETEADAAARAQKARAENLARQARVDDLKEKQARDQERIDLARRALAKTNMDDGEQVLALVDEMNAAYDKVAEAIIKGRDATQLHLDAIAKQKDLAEKILAIEKKMADEEERKKKARESFLEKYRTFLIAQEKAVADVGKANDSMADARHDRLAFSVEEAAAGKRGNASDRAKAREILRLEKRAKQLYDRDEIITDYSGRYEISGEDMLNRANDLRRSFSRLSTSEQNPFKSLEDQIRESNEHLKEIERSLAPTETD